MRNKKLFLKIILVFSILNCCNSQISKTENNTQPNTPINYETLKIDAANKKAGFKQQFDNSKNNPEKQREIILDAQNYLTSVVNDYFVAWYNTPWNFNGTSQNPQRGTIACGYFVTTHSS